MSRLGIRLAEVDAIRLLIEEAQKSCRFLVRLGTDAVLG